MVYADLADDALDSIAIPNGLAESLEDYTGYTFPSCIAIGLSNSISQWLAQRGCLGKRKSYFRTTHIIFIEEGFSTLMSHMRDFPVGDSIPSLLSVM